MQREHHSGSEHSAGKHAGQNHYARLGLMTALAFIAMFFLMYAMVNTSDNVHINLNQVYMAGLMAAPMVLIELLLMRGMYANKQWNMVIAGAAVVTAVVFFLFIRWQTAIGDRQFLRSMIPHHAAAILMCQQAALHNADIQQLCRNIISNQQGEIEQMNAMLRAARE